MARYDQLRLRGWALQVAIGAYESELAGPQELVLDVRLRGDFSAAAASDRLEDALDYAALRAAVEAWAAPRRWVLLEAFTADLCALLLAYPLVGEVEVAVDKPAAQAPAVVSCTMTRQK